LLGFNEENYTMLRPNDVDLALGNPDNFKFPRSMDTLNATHGFVKGWVHVYAEYRGRRYFFGSKQCYPDAQQLALDEKRIFPEAAFFLDDKSGSTSINGLRHDLNAAIDGENEDHPDDMVDVGADY